MSLLSLAFGITNFLVVVSFLSDSTNGCNPNDCNFVCFEYDNCLLYVSEAKNYSDAKLDCENRRAELAALYWDIFDGSIDNIVSTLVDKFPGIQDEGVYILTELLPTIVEGTKMYEFVIPYQHYPHEMIIEVSGPRLLFDDERALLLHVEENGNFNFTLRNKTEKSPFLCRYREDE